jgi:polyisoprenoid-binding protein YceI
VRNAVRVLILCTLLGWRATAGAGVPLVLDAERSTIEVEIRGTFGSFTGRLQQFEAAVSIDPAGPGVERAQVDFKFADLSTGRGRRDRDMLEWENHAQHPAVHFQLERLVTVVDGPQRARTQARGRLSMHGVEHSVLFPITFLAEGPVYSIDGEVDLDYRDYGLPVIRKYYMLTVDPHLRVRFHLQGRLATPVSPGP